MEQYNSGNIKLSHPQLNELKSATKNETGLTLKTPLNMVCNSNNETNFPHRLLNNRQVSNLHKAFANNSAANIKVS